MAPVPSLQAPATVPPPQPPSFTQALVSSVVGLLVVLGLILLAAMAWREHATSERVQRQELMAALDRAAERLQVLVRATQMTVDSAVRAARAPEVTAATLRTVLQASLSAFEQRPELSYLGIALPGGGKYGTLERTAAGEVLLWLFPGTRADDPVARSFLLTERGFELRDQRPADGYDPRGRPFYQAALDQPAGVWMPAYQWIVHPGSSDPLRDEPLWGLSYVKALRDDDGRLIAVLDTDFDLPALNHFLAGLEKDYGARFQIVELAGTPRLIGDSQVRRAPLPAPAAVASLATLSGEALNGDALLEDAAPDEPRRRVAARRLALSGGSSWLVVASRPAPFFAPALVREQMPLAGMGLVLMLGLALVSARMARRFGQPLAALERRAAGVGLQQPPEPSVAGPAFREIQSLDQTFTRMAEAVRQRERELSAQNSRLRSHLGNTPLAVVEWDAESRIVSVNAAATTLFGRPRPALVGQPVLSLVAPADRLRAQPVLSLSLSAPHQQRLYAKAWAGGGPSPACEWYVTRLDPDEAGQASGFALVLDVSQLLEARKQQVALQALKAAIFDSADMAIFSLDSAMAVIEWNGGAQRLFGLERPQVVGRPVAEVVRAPAGTVDWPAILATPGVGLFRFTGAGGAFDAELRQVKSTQDGREVRTLLLNDVSARQSAERRLREERDYADAVLDALPGVFYHYDERGRLRRWNRNLERLTGYAAQELDGADPRMFFNAQDHALVERGIREVFEKGAAVIEADYRLKDGTCIPHLFSGVRFERNGQVGFVGVGTDISARRAMEDALRESLARFDAAARATGDVVWDWNLETGAIWLNESFHILFGWSLQETGFTLESWLRCIHPEDRGRVLAHARAVIGGTENAYVDEFRARRKDGSWADLFVRGQVLRNAAGRGVRMVGAFQDISERKKAHAQLLIFNAELEQRVERRTRELQTLNRELESFSYSVSHDLRAPLRAISGFAEILARTHADALDATGQDHLGRVLGAVRRMEELIEGFLTLARVSREELRREPVDLGAIARDVLAGLRQAEPQRRVRAEVEDGLCATGDARLLRILLENLLGNAWKFTSRTPDAVIRFTAAPGDASGEHAFAVSDNGVGFDMRYAGKLFGPFQRLHAAAEFPGTGIGLATVRRIIERHGGRICAQAEPGKGATIRFSL